ncbi:aggregation-promoting factor C-terminal-like domain-containing protein [Streptomyces beihaiensis]|uniref:Transglycosylase SLT domain-containing protein n=1 Tax=Streptomyces beihaiensis TaxID=2984495 RepID=A0ABT3TR33_9ACTN|nr:transglycosylase SLT domain-containing protein [Streptomyces beihaiensis]MCX3059509.1 transglycosylase SLT domain-containing protein [Streptomyces beihaiensis]
MSATLLRRIATPKKLVAGAVATAAAATLAVTVAPAQAAPTSAKAIAQQKIGNSKQFQCFDNIVSRESGWNPSATNASTGAYGLVQALPANKMASAGSDWKTNPATQIKWGINYMNERYGSACGAWAHWQANGWY